jgi:thiol:disulfide interchange protein
LTAGRAALRSTFAAAFASALVVVATASAGTSPEGPFNPGADAWSDLRIAGARAASSGKLVLAEVGGNWSLWCRALDYLMAHNPVVRNELTAHFELVRVNYSPENKNADALERLQHPEKLGLPVVVVLSPGLDVLQIQGTDVFETGDPKVPGHDPAKVVRFLRASERLWPVLR